MSGPEITTAVLIVVWAVIIVGGLFYWICSPIPSVPTKLIKVEKLKILTLTTVRMRKLFFFRYTVTVMQEKYKSSAGTFRHVSANNFINTKTNKAMPEFESVLRILKDKERMNQKKIDDEEEGTRRAALLERARQFEMDSLLLPDLDPEGHVPDVDELKVKVRKHFHV